MHSALFLKHNGAVPPIMLPKAHKLCKRIREREEEGLRTDTLLVGVGALADMVPVIALPS